MMYKLEHLDELVMANLQTANENHLTLSEPDIARILHEVLQETEQIKKLLVRETFLFTKEKEIEVYINNYQLACTHLLDRMYAQQTATSVEDLSSAVFYSSFYQAILGLLSFIEERFSKYFDKTEKVPDVYLVLTKKELRQKQQSLSIALRALKEDSITSKLLNRLDAFVQEFPIQSHTYREIMFYKELVKEIEDISTWHTQQNIFSGLQQLLIYLNYNAKEFINDMVNRIATELLQLDDLNDRIDRLLLYSKTLHQLQLKPDSGLLFKHPSVQLQLGTWFSEELAYLEHLLSIMQLKNKTDNTVRIKQKIVCKLPVDQLGIFFRAAADLQIINTPNHKFMFEQIVPWLSTTNRPALSADSMRSKSYSPEKKDIEAVKDILMQLFRQVNKY